MSRRKSVIASPEGVKQSPGLLRPRQNTLAGPRNDVSRGVAFFFWAASGFLVLSMLAALIHGFPLPFFETGPFRIKSLRKLFELAFVFFALGVLFYPERKNFLISLKDKLTQIAKWRKTVWVLAGVYFVLFLWLQITKYLALEINFLPFSMYDYMLWYFDQGKFCYTGLLHTHYHLNLILLALYPVWKIFPTQWILHVAHPLAAVGAAVPFYYWSRDQLKDSLFALAAAFVYLNFRYLQNLLSINFGAEVFYPLFILSAVYFASKKKEIFYYLSVFLGLLVKEDSAVYFGGLGLFYLAFSPGNRRRGAATLVLSALYLAFLLKIFVPWSGSDILQGDVENYPAYGSTPGEILLHLAKHPWLLVKEFFYPFEKVRTLFKLTSRLLFLPLFSPWFLMVALSIYPLFFQNTGRGEFFFQLSFHYAAAVLPFVFLAFVDGWRRIKEARLFKKWAFVSWGGAALLILLNGLNLAPLHFTRDDVKTITLAKSLPRESIVVTQGHLLPYLGYRVWNFFLSPGYALNETTRGPFENPDYFLFDFQANPYPLSPEELRGKAEGLKKKKRQWKILHEDHRRLLLVSRHREERSDEVISKIASPLRGSQ